MNISFLPYICSFPLFVRPVPIRDVFDDLFPMFREPLYVTVANDEDVPTSFLIYYTACMMLVVPGTVRGRVGQMLRPARGARGAATQKCIYTAHRLANIRGRAGVPAAKNTKGVCSILDGEPTADPRVGVW